MPKMTPQEIIDLPIVRSETGAGTVRDYLIDILAKLWEKQHYFEGKRPFGQSDWTYNFYDTLVKHGVISGAFDEDGCLDSCDDKAGDAIIASAIEELRKTP